MYIYTCLPNSLNLHKGALHCHRSLLPFACKIISQVARSQYIYGQFRGNVNLGMVYKTFLKCILLGVISKNILWTFVKIQRLIFVTCCVAMETM